ncbi:hypothetical protein P692DRAFT_20822336 [Suillus brevipes Sb2]|nr:hypothetical protein P692DRAFT_20822336 [Suillus brevipes Sb2]
MHLLRRDAIWSARSIGLTQTKKKSTRAFLLIQTRHYHADVDSLPPMQAVVLDSIADIHLTGSSVPSLISRLVSEFSPIAFLVALHAPIPSPASLATPIAAFSQKQDR